MPLNQPTNSSEEPIGINVTAQVNEAMAQITTPNQPLMEKVGLGALQVAFAQYPACGRGMILGLESRGVRKFVGGHKVWVK
jgi:hypothetical protein